VLFLCPKCSKNPPTSISNSNNFPGGYTAVKGEGKRKKAERRKEEGGEGKGCVTAVGGWMSLTQSITNNTF